MVCIGYRDYKVERRGAEEQGEEGEGGGEADEDEREEEERMSRKTSSFTK